MNLPRLKALWLSSPRLLAWLGLPVLGFTPQINFPKNGPITVKAVKNEPSEEAQGGGSDNFDSATFSALENPMMRGLAKLGLKHKEGMSGDEAQAAINSARVLNHGGTRLSRHAVGAIRQEQL